MDGSMVFQGVPVQHWGMPSYIKNSQELTLGTDHQESGGGSFNLVYFFWACLLCKFLFCLGSNPFFFECLGLHVFFFFFFCRVLLLHFWGIFVPLPPFTFLMVEGRHYNFAHEPRNSEQKYSSRVGKVYVFSLGEPQNTATKARVQARVRFPMPGGGYCYKPAYSTEHKMFTKIRFSNHRYFSFTVCESISQNLVVFTIFSSMFFHILSLGAEVT